MRALITCGLFPVTFIAAMSAATYAVVVGLDHATCLVVTTVVTMLIVGVFERIHPAYPSWKRDHGDVRTDVLHGVFSSTLVSKALEVGAMALILRYGVEAGGLLGIWPTSWPLALQVVLALVVGQLGEYWAHRALHEIPALWRFHAVHHSSERLYFLNAGRFHPVDTAMLFFAGLFPVLIAGAGPDVLLLLVTWITVHGLFQHGNVKVRLGLLNYIFSMAELHRWHHSLNLEEANRNYGNNILLWDLVFGTVYWPKDRDASEHIGNGIDAYPKGFVGQLIAPFRDPPERG